jgi:hypothetical protein
VPLDFKIGGYHPVFSSCCEIHLELILKHGGRNLWGQRGTWYYNYGPIDREEFLLMLSNYVEEHCRRAEKGLPIELCQAHWKYNGKCLRWAKGQVDGVWLCTRHITRGASQTDLLPRNKLAERIAAELLRECA